MILSRYHCYILYCLKPSFLRLKKFSFFKRENFALQALARPARVMPMTSSHYIYQVPKTYYNNIKKCRKQIRYRKPHIAYRFTSVNPDTYLEKPYNHNNNDRYKPTVGDILARISSLKKSLPNHQFQKNESLKVSSPF
jgi:hypothetical protein